jgi:hypothetical protein
MTAVMTALSTEVAFSRENEGCTHVLEVAFVYGRLGWFIHRLVRTNLSEYTQEPGDHVRIAQLWRFAPWPFRQYPTSSVY